MSKEICLEVSPFRHFGDRWGPKYVEIQSKTFVTVAIWTGQSVILKETSDSLGKGRKQGKETRMIRCPKGGLNNVILIVSLFCKSHRSQGW